MAAATAPALTLVSSARGKGRAASFWRFEGSPAPGAGRAPILALAGLGLDGRVFARLGALSRDRDLVLANLPNAMAPGSAMEDFGREALSILDAAGHAGRPAVLLGSSFGAMVALAAASVAGPRAAALVLIGGVPSWGFVPLGLRAASVLHPLVPRAAYPRVLATVLLPPGRMEPSARADLRVQMLHRTKGFLGATLGAMRRFDALPGLPSLRVPALVLHGDRDDVLPLRGGRAMAEALPRATFVGMPGAGHLPHVARPEEVVAAVAAFLGREGL